jgi:hypothetical protein
MESWFPGCRFAPVADSFRAVLRSDPWRLTCFQVPSAINCGIVQALKFQGRYHTRDGDHRLLCLMFRKRVPGQSAQVISGVDRLGHGSVVARGDSLFVPAT